MLQFEAVLVPLSVHLLSVVNTLYIFLGWGCCSLVEHRTIILLMQVRFSQSQLSMQTLLHVPVRPRVQLHALTAVRTLKIL